jgi:hypothetical protein
VNDLYDVIVKMGVLVFVNRAENVTLYDTVFVADSEREFTDVLVRNGVNVIIFVTGVFLEGVDDPVEETVARLDAVPVVEELDVFDELIDFVLVTVLRIVGVSMDERVGVLLTSRDREFTDDAVDVREDFIVKLIIELPVDVLLELIDGVPVKLFLLVIVNFDVGDKVGDAVTVFDGADERELVDDDVDVLDNTAEREYVGLAVVVLLVVAELVVVLEKGYVFVRYELELDVLDGICEILCNGLDDDDLDGKVVRVLVFVDVDVLVDIAEYVGNKLGWGDIVALVVRVDVLDAKVVRVVNMLESINIRGGPMGSNKMSKSFQTLDVFETTRLNNTTESNRILAYIYNI